MDFSLLILLLQWLMMQLVKSAFPSLMKETQSKVKRGLVENRYILYYTDIRAKNSLGKCDYFRLSAYV